MIIAVFDMMDSAMTTNSMICEQSARDNMNFWITKKTEADAALAAHKETIDGLKKAAGKGTWRERAGQAVASPELQAAEKRTPRYQDAVDTAEKNIQSWKIFVDGWQKDREDRAEVDRWIQEARRGNKIKTPDCILRMEEAFNNELIPGCVAIPIPTIYKR
jgi:hypothetical protein